jgi:hypothetical protein
VRYFVVPKVSDWWLEHYQGLSQHLSAAGRKIDAGDACAIFDLGEPANGTGSGTRRGSRRGAGNGSGKHR